MKVFNQMTEMEMEQKSGGCFVCATFALLAGLIGLTVGYQVTDNAMKSN